MGTITSDFSYREFEESATARRKGICNVIADFGVRDAVKELAETVLQPLRDRVGHPLRINSGYRCPELNREIPNSSPTSQHCFDTATEILTDNGWRTNATISVEDKVFTYNFKTGLLELKPINEIIRRHFCGDLYRISNKHSDVVCTDRHNVIVKYDSHKYVRRGSNKITAAGQAYFDSLKTNNDQFHLEMMKDVHGKRRSFMVSGYSSEKTAYDASFMRFVMAVVADGYFGYHCGKTPFVGFHVKKERKVSYLRIMMDSLGIKHSARKDKDGAYYFYVGKEIAEKTMAIIGAAKNLPYYLLRADVKTLRELVGTYAFFDGHKDTRKNNVGVSITTTNEHNASVLQAMCILSGMRCTLSHREGVRNVIRGKLAKSAKRLFNLSICPDYLSTKFKEANSVNVPYDGEIWCVRDDNDTVIIRRNGLVTIQGNCKGEAADIAAADPLALATVARNTPGIWREVDQMIVYPTFVHFSHRRGGPQRRQLLYNRRWTGGRVEVRKAAK